MPAPLLFQPLTLRSLTLKNRVGVSPMCQYSAKDGFANDWHAVHLGSRAVGGAGLVMVEATAVLPEGRISPGDTGLWTDAHAEPFARIAHFCRSHGAAMGIQLAHAGRKASCAVPLEGGRALTPERGGWVTVAPSPVPFHPGDPAPNALTEAGLDEVVTAFAQAARRARNAGFQVVEVHAAHGYLLHSFLSPLSNHRSDAYGGSFDNRIKPLLKVVRAVRSVWDDALPVLVRISASDWDPNGWTPEDSVALAQRLKAEGVDLVDCSSGGIAPHIQIPVKPGYQVPFAGRVRKEAGMPTAAVGLLTDAHQVEEVLQTGQADLVFLARAMLRNPYWALYAAHVLRHELPWPVQYARAVPLD
jgi:2,4-dienoyl-CoA reductase-like NADH-dependent reductase (Old Yellow Enzyme family)